MIYYKTEEKEKGFRFYEPERNPDYNRKTEAVFAQCNGFLGIRASFETKQLDESRGTFIGGLYHKAGVHGVCPLSIFVRAIFKSKYWQTHEASFTLPNALGDKTRTETPGGQAKAFCEPVIMTSAASSRMSNGSARNVLTQSTIMNKLLRLQKPLISSIS